MMSSICPCQQMTMSKEVRVDKKVDSLPRNITTEQFYNEANNKIPNIEKALTPINVDQDQIDESITFDFLGGVNNNSDVSKPLNILKEYILKEYKECCHPLHARICFAENAEILMRSRYSAFVMGLTEYIISTTLPAQQNLLDRQSIEDWAKQTQWLGLSIEHHVPRLGKHHAQVEFKAYHQVTEANEWKVMAHHERSTFVKVQAVTDSTGHTANEQNYRWYFLDPTVSLKVTQKQPCVCGSGEKFKRCCGQYV